MASPDACARLLDQMPAVGEIKRQLHRITPSMGHTAVPLLAVLATEGEQRSSDLAERLRLDLSVVSRQVAGMIESGLVVRTTDRADRRAHRLAITDAGRQLLTSIREQMVGVMAKCLADWDDADVLTLAVLLRRYSDAVAEVVTVSTVPAFAR